MTARNLLMHKSQESNPGGNGRDYRFRRPRVGKGSNEFGLLAQSPPRVKVLLIHIGPGAGFLSRSHQLTAFKDCFNGRLGASPVLSREGTGG